MEQDPICGMNVDSARTTLTYVHAGRNYYFCGKSCLAKFAQAPT